MTNKRYRLVCMLLIAYLTALLPLTAVQAGDRVTAESAILMDAQTGVILYQSGAFDRRPPASTTKILTALVALERGNLADRVTVSRRAATTEGSSIWLREGEQLTLDELLHGALLESGNDACVAIAEHIAGSETNFVQMMNDTARSLGAFNTHFVNSNGLPAPEHYTTAHDLARIATAALRNPTFAAIVSTRTKHISWPGEEWERSLQNTNKLLTSFPGADGVKTGTTKEAGQCLVASATRNNQRLIAVVLRSTQRWNDATCLLEYGFDSYRLIRAVEKGEVIDLVGVEGGRVPELALLVADSLSLVVPVALASSLRTVITLDGPIHAPVRSGQKLGIIKIMAGDNTLKEVNLVAERDVPQKPVLYRLFDNLQLRLKQMNAW